MTSSSTRLVAIIGHPIVQVKSPDNFNRYFTDNGLDRVMIPVDVAAESVADFVSLFRGWHNMDGFVVTIPHKGAVAALVDEMTPRARFLNAVNVVRKDAAGRVHGDMVDGDGFLGALRQHAFSPAGKAALLTGAGAAGSAIAHALTDSGVASLAIGDIDAAKAKALVERLAGAFPNVTFKAGFDEAERFDLVVNASPMGMHAGDPIPVAQAVIDNMAPDGLAADVVTSPERTPFLERAAARGLKTQTGPEMAKAQLLVLGRFMGVVAGKDENA